MKKNPNVVVIGAGTLGMSTAISLVERGAQVTVLEAQSIASGSSGRSVGVVGSQMTNAFDVELRKHSFDAFNRWEKEDGLTFNRIGYLRLARTAEQMELFEKSVQMQTEAGFRAHVVPKDKLTEVVPHMDTDGLAGGVFGPDNGFIDPYELCMMLAQKVKDLGGKVRQFCQLESVERDGSGFVLHTSKGPIECDMVVNAAGAWAPQVAEMFGQTLHICSMRHEAVPILLDQPLGYKMPMVMDLVNGEGTGLNFRHENDKELIAEIHVSSSVSSEDPDAYNDQCDDESKYGLAELLLERLPDLPGARLGRGWAGLYPVTQDNYPFVGPIDPEDTSIITAAGAGGYGIQLAPVIGLVAADWVLHGEPVTVPNALQLAPTPERNQPAL
ncbi:MAG: hypothetical protein CSA68_11875 [Rhodobacterales bacterium]|nr:MAG: hypothetical protein CSA68_11875 [Rhodobacterales bacterium]